MKTGIQGGCWIRQFLWLCILSIVLAGLPPWSLGGEVTTGFWPDSPRTAKFNHATLTAIRDAANQGDSSAQLALARLNLDGSQFAPDPVEAFAWYEKAAEQGEPESQFMLGVQLERGLFANRDYEQALKWYRASAEKGLLVAQLKLGLLYSRPYPQIAKTIGNGNHLQEPLVGASYEDAVKWLEKAAAAGIPTAQAQLARIYRKIHDHIQPPSDISFEADRQIRLSGLKWLYLASAQGEPDTRGTGSLYRLAGYSSLTNEAHRLAEDHARLIGTTDFRHEYDLLVFLNPLPAQVEFDPRQPPPPQMDQGRSRARFDALVKAAKAGDVRSQYLLGLSLQFGGYPGVGMINQFDGQEAAKWYSMAANQGFLPAQLALGFININNPFPEATNLTAAAQWFQKTADQGLAAGKFQLGRMYDQGKGVERDYTQAVKWYEAAANDKYPPALKVLNKSNSSVARQVSSTAKSQNPGSKAPNSGAVRLAVIPAASEVSSYADLIVAQLSSTQGVALVERDQINRVLAEQALSAGGQKNYLKLGQLLNADCILLIEPYQREGARRLSLRLVAVGPGAVMDWVDYPLPIPDPAGWGSIASTHIAGRLGNVRDNEGRVVSLSVLNLRSPIANAQARSMERELTLLLTHRLSREKGLVVLERREMNALEREKQLAVVESDSFRQGSYLLEGTLNKDGYSDKVLTVAASLVPPDGGKRVQIEYSGQPSRLMEAAESLAAKISTALQIKPSDVAWTPLDEAAKYFEEARWALNWKMYPEAQSAADAAWTLGLRSEEMAKLRISCFSKEPQYSHLLKSEDWRTLYEKIPGGILDKRFVTVSTRAVEIFNEFSSNLPRDAAGKDGWYEFGNQLLREVATTLKVFVVSPVGADASAAELARLRQACRETLGILDSVPALKGRVFETRMKCGSVFFDTPGEYANRLVELASSDYGKSLRESQSGMQWNWEPLLPVGWNFADRHEAKELVTKVLLKMDQSSDPYIRLDGAMWGVKIALNGRSIDGGSDYELEDRCRLLLERMKENEGLIFSRDNQSTPYSQESLMYFLKGAVSSGVSSEFKDRFREKVLPQFLKEQEESRVRWTELARLEKVKLLASTLALRPMVEIRKLQMEFGTLQIKETDKPLLLDRILSYKREFTGPSNSLYWLSSIEARLAVAPPNQAQQVHTNSSVPPVARIGGPDVIRQMAAGGFPLGRPFDTGGNVKSSETNSRVISIQIPKLEAKRLWMPDMFKPSPGKAFDYFYLNPLGYRGDRLWFQATIRESENFFNAKWSCYFLGVRPDTMESLIVQLDEAPPELIHSSQLLFEVFGSKLIYSFKGVLKEYDLSTKQWRKLSISLPLERQFHSLPGRLFCVSNDSILDVDLDSGVTKVLASSRRRPPLSVLDKLDSFGIPPIWIDGKKQPHTFINQKEWLFDSAISEWVGVGEPYDRKGHRFVTSSADGMYLQVGENQYRAVVEGKTMQEFNVQTDTDELTGGYPDSRGQNPSTNSLPLNVRNPQLISDGRMTWISSHLMRSIPRGVTSFSSFEEGVGVGLFAYTKGATRPYLTLITLKRADMGGGLGDLAVRSDIGFSKGTTCYPFPGGVALYDDTYNGFWVVKSEELQLLWAQQDVLVREAESNLKARLTEWRHKRLVQLKALQGNWLQMYDRNGNNKLDDNEVRLAEANVIYRKQQKEIAELTEAIEKEGKAK